jgi:uncharacterized protein
VQAVPTEHVRFRAADDLALTLDGRLRSPHRTPAGIAVLTHPHPSYGGNMDVWLLPTIAERLAEHGWASLRFNFRSAGSGAPCDGHAETGDLAGAVGFVVGAFPDLSRVALVGWSFGALVGMLYGPTDPRVTDWVGIGAPTRVVSQAPMAPPPTGLAGWTARKTVIVGEHDTFFPPSTVGVLAPDVVQVVPGADHFLFDRDDEVADLIVTALA